MQRDSESARAAWLAPQGPREGLVHYVEVVRERLRLIVACVLVATLAAGAYAKLTTPTWKAQSNLLFTPVSGNTGSLIGLGLIVSSGSPTNDVSTAASFVTTPEVAALVAARIGHTTPSAVLGQVAAVPVAQSNVIAITATASSATRAQAIANAFALGTVQNRTQTLHQQINAIIPPLQAQVQALPPAQRTGQGSLGERLASLQALRAGPDPTIGVESFAQRPGSPSSPKTKLSIVAGLLVGLVIGLAVAFAQEGLDPRVRREERLRRIFRLPVLARIPRERHRSSRGLPLRPSDLSPAVHESYRMLRVSLSARGSSATARSVMVTGSTRSEGKSTVALNLAATLAQGGKEVILVEADLRRPSLASALGIRPDLGMDDVLMNEVELEDALITVDWLGENLRMLLVGQAGPYLADGLLAATDQLVQRVEALSDYVVFDAPPVTEVSDVLPLTRQVDDVLIVARLGHSRADQLVNLGEVLARQDVRPAGLVIVGDDLGQANGYYAVAPRSTRRGVRRLRRASTAPLPR